MKRIWDTFQGLAGGWKAVDPDTHVEIKGSNFKILRATWIAHRKANGLSYFEVEDWIHEQTCARIPAVCSEKGRAPDKQNPTFEEMMVNLRDAVWTWAKDGFRMSAKEVVAERRAICAGAPGREKCDYWNPRAYLGRGRCDVCGCSNTKWHLQSSVCPKGKWPR